MPTLPAFDVKTNINHSPHVVLLGAGASLAALPNGDACGRHLPLMNNLIEIVGLEKILKKYGYVNNIENFESFYDDLTTSEKNDDLIKEIESYIYSYFTNLGLPDEPNIYDYLILSLRKTDLIATFNWDPFLAQAYRRNMMVTEPPKIVFLHGNVEIGACSKDKRTGFSNQKCGKCGEIFKQTQLLYPVKHKDYQADSFINNEWNVLRMFLKRAYYLTIFGYSAPATDVEAKSLMLEVWKDNPTLELAEVEIIDIKKREELENTWKEFVFSHHSGTRTSIFDSYLFNHPRRSCDAFAMATLQNSPWHTNKYPRFKDLKELHEWIQPLLKEEENKKFTGDPCT